MAKRTKSLYRLTAVLPVSIGSLVRILGVLADQGGKDNKSNKSNLDWKEHAYAHGVPIKFG